MVSVFLVSFGGLGLCLGMAFLMDTLAANIFRLPDASLFPAVEALAQGVSRQS